MLTDAVTLAVSALCIVEVEEVISREMCFFENHKKIIIKKRSSEKKNSSLLIYCNISRMNSRRPFRRSWGFFEIEKLIFFRKEGKNSLANECSADEIH
jgi:hypothetical protein